MNDLHEYLQANGCTAENEILIYGMMVGIICYIFLYLFIEVSTTIVAEIVLKIHRHTKHYQKRYKETLALYDSCRELLHDLYMKSYFDSNREEYDFLLDSIEKNKDKKTKGVWG